MKTINACKLVFITLICINTSLSAQWNPRPNNPFKWYHITKDTTLNEISVFSFDVCLYQWAGRYKKFAVDSLGNPTSNPHLTTIWFKVFASGSKERNTTNEERFFSNWAADFEGIPFICVDGEIGVSPIVPAYLAEKFNVSINDITQ
jgi:hypothetical protein